MSRSVQYSRNCKFPNKAGFKWWMGVVAVLLVVILAVLIYLGVKAWQRRAAAAEKV